MVASPRAAGVAEDEDALGVIHEGGGLGEIGRGGAVLDHQPIALADDAARAAGDLGDHVGAEALDDLVERARTGGSEASFSIRRSRRATASRLWTGWPSR